MSDSVIANSVAVRRHARGWSQAELAHRAGISRAAVSAIEGERLTPSVSAALALASVLHCSVEELFTTDKAGVSVPMWAWAPRGGTCRYWEAVVAGKRRLYPVEASAINSLPHDGIWAGSEPEVESPMAQRTLVMACCDPAAGLLASEYARESGFRLLIFPRGGRSALDLLRRRLIHIAGVHFSTDEQPERNGQIVRFQLTEDCEMIHAARWETGIALSASDDSRSVDSVAHRPLRWAAREPGSAARECLDELLGNTPFKGRQVDSHPAVAEAVHAGWAQAGVCIQYSAEEAGLNFIPLRRESLDLCFPSAIKSDPRIVALTRLLQSHAHRRMEGELPGYNSRNTGESYSIVHHEPASLLGDPASNKSTYPEIEKHP